MTQVSAGLTGEQDSHFNACAEEVGDLGERHKVADVGCENADSSSAMNMKETSRDIRRPVGAVP